jgi:molecular chaperone DnaJ
VPRPTHYDTLGVAPSASATEIRDAYRRLARTHHPDRAATGPSEAAAATFTGINEAYRVLNDPARRAVYDAGLRAAPAAPGPAAPPRSAPAEEPPLMHPSHAGPARIPWRSMLILAVLGVVGVVVLAQFTQPSEPPGPDGILRSGDCVEIEPVDVASEVACTGDPEVDQVVRLLVAFDATCPGSLTPYRDRQGMGIACVESP